MNGVSVDELRDALTSPDFVEKATGEGSARVWVPRTATPAATETPPVQVAPRTPTEPPPPAPAETGGLVISVGAPGRQFSAPTDLQPQEAVARSEPTTARKAGPDRKPNEELPDGVLARITNGMAAAIGVVALVGMAEAAFNLGRFVLEILKLPLPLAIGFPAIFEIAAATFAIQDARDRRQGHANRAMRVATYLTLIASSAVNGIVGFASHGRAGLIEIVPPLMLAGLIHLHGDRATRAHHSQAVLRPAWREAQLKAARRESVMDVLPLLAGDDEHGRATVELLRQRLESETLEPGDALLAAGWFDRFDRDMPPTMLRRLETVAATVWGSAGAPIPVRPLVPVPVRRPRSAGSSTGSTKRSTPGLSSGSTTGSTSRSDESSTESTPRSPTGSSPRSTPRSSGGSSPRSDGSKRSIQELRSRSIEDLMAELTTAYQSGALRADSTITAVREHLQVHPDRARALHRHLQEIASTPPHLRALPSSDRGSSSSSAGEDGAVAEGGR